MHNCNVTFLDFDCDGVYLSADECLHDHGDGNPGIGSGVWHGGTSVPYVHHEYPAPHSQVLLIQEEKGHFQLFVNLKSF